MFIGTADTQYYADPGWNISPHGEWRWTSLGLSGRDPIFLAQLDSELAILKKEFAADPDLRDTISSELSNLCLSCHGVMGKRQHDLDNPHTDPQFTVAHVYATDRRDEMPTKAAEYGALARDGISCTVCHRMQPRPQPADEDRPYLQHFLATSITGWQAGRIVRSL